MCKDNVFLLNDKKRVCQNLTHPLLLRFQYYLSSPIERFRKRSSPSPLSMLLLNRAMSMS